MCSTENKETRLGKTLGSVRATDKGRRNKREQKNTKPKKRSAKACTRAERGFKRLHNLRICELLDDWAQIRKL